MKKRQKEEIVLLVEDNPASIGMVNTALEAEGYLVSVATTGEKALERAERTLPDLILLDILLPGIDGYETCRRLKGSEKTKEIPILFMSGLTESFDKVKGFDLGAVDYITKPIDTSELLARIRTHLSIQRMQDELRAAKELAESANRTKSRFLAHMSHELRSPLQGILGFSELIQTYPDLTPQIKKDIRAISNSGNHLLKLINDLLEMAKIDAGRTTLDMEDFNLHATVRFVQEMFRATARKNGLELKTRISPDVPKAVHSDPFKIRQILINLLSNAVKFTKNGQILLEVDPFEEESRMFQDPSQSPDTIPLIFKITDTGQGIAQEEMEILFEPFQQTKYGRKNGGGTGLGLAICRSFVRLMGGEIRVESEIGKGTTFTIILPLGLSKITEAPAIKKVQPASSKGMAIFGSRILIVDDDTSTRMILRKFIEQEPYSIEEAKNGMEALARYKAFQPDLIWMDLTMPEFGGLQVVKEIRSLEKLEKLKRVPAIAISASGFKEQKDEAISSGYDDFLEKPFRKENVLALTQKYLGRYHPA